MAGIEFTCEAGALAKAINDVRDVVRGAQVIPILANVLIEAMASGEVTLTATNLDIIATRVVTATVAEAGSTTVPAARFGDVVGAFESGAQCHVKLDEGKVIARAGRARFTFATLKADDFPKMPFGDAVATIEMPRDDLMRALDATRHAISTEETRYYLNGVFVHTVGGKDLRFASTDGHRLARYVMPLPKNGKAIPDTIIRTATVDLVRKIAANREADVRIEFGATKTRFDFGDLIVVAKAVEGTFPDYARTIPATPPKLATIDKDAMAASAARVAQATDDKVRSLKLAFTRDKVTISANGAASQGVEEVPCEYDGAEIDIGFNSRYLRDAMAALNVDTIEIGMDDPVTPTLFTSTVSKDLSLVVMPIRV